MSFAGSVGAMERLDAPEYRDMWARLLAQLIGADESQGGARSHHAASDDQALAKRTAERDGEAVRRQQHSDARRDSGASQSEDTAFEAFFQRHEQPLYGYLRRMLPTHEIAVEVAQEAFFRAWTHFEEVRAYERPEAWLYRVATNLAITQLRRRHPLSFAQVFRRAPETEAVSDDGAHEMLADPLDMEGDVAARDLINRTLLRLPERYRAALLLRALHGFSGEEIAEMLDISLANARQILSRGRERFRQLYEKALREGDEST